jgi:hypothetical protein
MVHPAVPLADVGCNQVVGCSNFRLNDNILSTVCSNFARAVGQTAIKIKWRSNSLTTETSAVGMP